MAAAIATGIPLFIISRPLLPAHFKLVCNEAALLEQVKPMCA
jgi:hypothetical protein